MFVVETCAHVQIAIHMTGTITLAYQQDLPAGGVQSRWHRVRCDRALNVLAEFVLELLEAALSSSKQCEDDGAQL